MPITFRLFNEYLNYTRVKHPHANILPSPSVKKWTCGYLGVSVATNVTNVASKGILLDTAALKRQNLA
jgi:hypothetical protein